MLREMVHVRQVAGERHRRWFFCRDMDLVIWLDEHGAICSFQLAYNKRHGERSVAWHIERGLSHYMVDNGEPSSGINNTPLMYQSLAGNTDIALQQFLNLSKEMPSDVARFIEGELRKHITHS